MLNKPTRVYRGSAHRHPPGRPAQLRPVFGLSQQSVLTKQQLPLSQESFHIHIEYLCQTPSNYTLDFSTRKTASSYKEYYLKFEL